MNDQRQILDISWETILKVCLAGSIFYLLYLIRDVVIWFLFALIISVLFEPAINFLRRLRVPKVLAVVFIYLFVFGILGMMIYLSAPLFITEIRDFVRIAPDYFDKVSPIFDSLKIESLQSLNNFTQGVTGGLENVSSNIFNALAAFFGGLASAFFILSLSFFLSLEDRSVEKFLLLIAPKKYESYVLTIFEKSQAKVSGWFGARVIACLFVAIASFAVFYFFGIQYSFILAFLAGVLNFVPFIGALIVGILLVVLIGISDSLMKALIILGLFAIIQQLENQIISPVLTKKFIGLPPVLVLLSLVAGGMVFGFLGAVFAVPVFGILYEFIKEFLEKRKEDEVDLNIIS